jgi:hypothetical protein
MDHILSQLNQVYIFNTCYSMMLSNIILSSTTKSPKQVLPTIYNTQNFTWITSFSYACYMPSPFPITSSGNKQ